MGLHLRGNILGYEEVKAPKKLVVTGARNTFEAHRMFDQVEFHEKELLPFYNLHLKGANNGFMDAEPVRLFVRGANVWRAEEEWPPKRATPVVYHLRKGPSGSVTSLNDGGLSIANPAPAEPATSYTYPDWEWVNGVAVIGPDGRVDPARRVLTFTTGPLEADLEVTGPIVLKLYVSSSAIDTQFIVKLTDQHPQDAAARAKGEQPAYTPVSKGWLKASHREKDAARSTPERPFYTHVNPQPLTPGEIYRVRYRGAADRLRVQERPPHQARACQRQLARDRRRVLTSVSSVPDGHRHDPPRRRACLVPHPAGDRPRASAVNQEVVAHRCAGEKAS